MAEQNFTSRINDIDDILTRALNLASAIRFIYPDSKIETLCAGDDESVILGLSINLVEAIDMARDQVAELAGAK